MNGYQAAVDLLPANIRAAAQKISGAEQCLAAEFRLRRGRRPSLVLPEGEREFLDYTVASADLARTLERACHSSPYTVKENLTHGYVIAPGGVRLGLCGRMNGTGVGEYSLAELSSLSVRIPRQIVGCAQGIVDRPIVSTLILSPPGWGKTTLLRDMIRLVSDLGIRVGLCDERGEVAAFSHGTSGFDVGRCTDVMTGLPKARAAIALLRSMNPQILAMDEITAPEDVSACAAAANCGVQLLATAHGKTKEELYARPIYRQLLDSKIFHRLIIISVESGRRSYRKEKL